MEWNSVIISGISRGARGSGQILKFESLKMWLETHWTFFPNAMILLEFCRLDEYMRKEIQSPLGKTTLWAELQKSVGDTAPVPLRGPPRVASTSMARLSATSPLQRWSPSNFSPALWNWSKIFDSTAFSEIAWHTALFGHGIFYSVFRNGTLECGYIVVATQNSEFTVWIERGTVWIECVQMCRFGNRRGSAVNILLTSLEELATNRLKCLCDVWAALFKSFEWAFFLIKDWFWFIVVSTQTVSLETEHIPSPRRCVCPKSKNSRVYHEQKCCKRTLWHVNTTFYAHW